VKGRFIRQSFLYDAELSWQEDMGGAYLFENWLEYVIIQIMHRARNKVQ